MEVGTSKVVPDQSVSRSVGDGRHFFFPKQEANSDDELPMVEMPEAIDFVADNSTDPLMCSNESTQDSSRAEERVKQSQSMLKPYIPLSNFKFEDEDGRESTTTRSSTDIVFPVKTDGTGLHVYFPNSSIAKECFTMIKSSFPVAKFVQNDFELQDSLDQEEETCQEEPRVSPADFAGFNDPDEYEVNVLNKRISTRSSTLELRTLENNKLENETNINGPPKVFELKVPQLKDSPKKKRGRPAVKRPHVHIPPNPIVPGTEIKTDSPPKKKRGRPFKTPVSPELVSMKHVEMEQKKIPGGPPENTLDENNMEEIFSSALYENNNLSIVSSTSSNGVPGKKKRGRPVGSSNKKHYLPMVSSTPTDVVPEKKKRGRPFGSSKKNKCLAEQPRENTSTAEDYSSESKKPDIITPCIILPGGAVVERVDHTVKTKRSLRKRTCEMDTLGEGPSLKNEQLPIAENNGTCNEEKLQRAANKILNIASRRSYPKKQSTEASLAAETTGTPTKVNGSVEKLQSAANKILNISSRRPYARKQSTGVSLADEINQLSSLEKTKNCVKKRRGRIPKLKQPVKLATSENVTSTADNANASTNIPAISNNEQPEAEKSVSSGELPSEPPDTEKVSGNVITNVITGNTNASANILANTNNELPESEKSVSPGELRSEPPDTVEKESGPVITNVISGNANASTNIPAISNNEQPEAEKSLSSGELPREPPDIVEKECATVITNVITDNSINNNEQLVTEGNKFPAELPSETPDTVEQTSSASGLVIARVITDYLSSSAENSCEQPECLKPKPTAETVDQTANQVIQHINSEIEGETISPELNVNETPENPVPVVVSVTTISYETDLSLT